MGKPINEYGGWLVFCRICIILSLIFIIGNLISLFSVVIISVFLYNTVERQIFFSAITAIFAELILVLIQMQIIKILKTQASDIPAKISKLFIAWSVSVIAFWGVFLVMDHFNMLLKSNKNNKMIVAFEGLIIPLTWIAYFKWSKRVRAYYGHNAFK